MSSLEELFASAIPGHTIRLPTLGLFNEPTDFAEGTDPDNFLVHTFSMLQEIQYKSPALIMNGHATYTMLKQVAPQILKPSSMCNCDIECIMLAARIASYGPTMNTTFECSNPATNEDGTLVCAHKSSFAVDLDNLLLNYPSLSVEQLADWQIPIKGGRNITINIHLKLPTHKAVVDILELMSKHGQYMRLLDTVDLTDEQQAQIVEDLTSNLADANFIKIFSHIRKVEANGQTFTDKEEISKVINARSFPKSWMNMINTKIDEVAKPFTNGGFIDVACEQCGFVTEGVNVMGDSSSFFIQG